MTPREKFAVELRGILAEADAAFVKTGDPMDALGWIGLAAKSGVELPPHMGAWLHQALQTYIKGEGTMDAAMALRKHGAGSPRRRRREASWLNDIHGKMWFLIAAGATRTQAAELVSTIAGRSVEQLLRTYGKSWFVRRADAPFDGMHPTSVLQYLVETLLPEFPDDERTREAKATILARYPQPDVLDGFGGWRCGGWVGEDPDLPTAS